MKNHVLTMFGKKIREERLKKDISQEKLAELAGVHRTYIGMIERGEKNITLINIHKIVKALDIKFNTIFNELD